MKARLNQLELVGTSRTVKFNEGLSVVFGPITTGKTTLLRLCRVIFGAAVDRFPREVTEHVRAIAADIALGDENYSIIRPLSVSPTAKVEIAGTAEALRLPALAHDPTSDMTYGQWLLTRLGLPQIEVPSAPTREDSTSTPVSINDYFLYCSLPQHEIDAAVFGHRDPFKDIKRRYVFQILYGIYDVQTALLQERLRTIQQRLTALASQTAAFAEIVRGTPWENRAEIAHELDEAIAARAKLSAESLRESESRTPLKSELRSQLLSLDASISELRSRLEREKVAIEELHGLEAQLQTNSARMTRSIVAGELLVDFEFVMCPRCGSSIRDRNPSSSLCTLCLQPPGQAVTKADLVSEQERIGAQIVETRELVEVRERIVSGLDQRRIEMETKRRDLGRQLDEIEAHYVSDSAQQIADRAARGAALDGRVSALSDYLKLYERLDAAGAEAAKLQSSRETLLAQLELAKSRETDAESKIRHLESRFRQLLEEFHVPHFGDGSPARIDRRNYLPIIGGRRYDELSSQGLLVLVNVAHALAHHLTAIDLGLPLPGILLIDGLTSNLGHEGEDLERVQGIYKNLIAIAEDVGDRLQIVVADNDLPEYVRDRVVLNLSDDDRLIPLPT